MIAENLATIHVRIAHAAHRCGRRPEEIKLVAVSKRFPAGAINAAVAAGQTLFGENYVQELVEKREDVDTAASFHFIGHLQTNKAKAVAETCRMVETVDRLKLGKALNKHLSVLHRSMDILVQVNIGEDPNKSGSEADDAEDLIVRLRDLDHLRICGLMTMTPYFQDPEKVRPYFRKLRALTENLAAKGLFATNSRPEISMGMSNDFEVAIEEGATIIRVGTAIFGERQ